MAASVQSWTLGELAGLVGGEVRGDPTLPVERPVPAGSDDPLGITFAVDDRYLERVLRSSVGAVIAKKDCVEFTKPAILVESPRVAFAKVLGLAARPLDHPGGIHETAVVDPTATVDPGAAIGAYCVVGAEARIGCGAVVHPLSFIGPRCVVGDRCVLYPRVVLVQDVALGSDVIVHSGAVLGADGFGYAWDGERHAKVPQAGGLLIGPGCEIGANACIDRATCGESRIGTGVKIDNLVHIGHNAEIGDHTVMAAQVGMSGSVTVGERVVAGGQTGFADHVDVTSDVSLAGRAGVTGSIAEPGVYFGTPATPIARARRIVALQRKLPELNDRLKALEAEIERLRREG